MTGFVYQCNNCGKLTWRDEALDQMRRHDGRSGRDRLQRGKIRGRPARMIGHRLDDRGHQHRQGRALAREAGKRGVGGKTRMDGLALAKIGNSGMESSIHSEHFIIWWDRD